MTYAELKDTIANYLNRSDLTSMMDTFINQVETELNRRIRTKDMIKRATATADSQYLTLPTDWLEAINVEITSGDFTPLFQVSIESLDVYRKSQNNRTGKPVWFAIVNSTLELCPNPDVDYDLQLTYFGKLDPLSDSNTTNFVSTDHSDLYLYGALKTASIYLMDDNRVSMFHQAFEKSIEEIRMEQERASFAQGSLIPRRRTYGKRKKEIAYWGNN